ncbi:UDP-N-acetylmuramoyl-L-alanyl-D-glutamate--2,6-diaminopimelate ligase [Candidatus Sumerlaeota bacterium]|nr:UDP-N-acetylmuramoyl-L-alanyl-D-glutamate--2,6-diaminopimelate ligase [Candidatus Sumerlaeota bacterium]
MSTPSTFPAERPSIGAVLAAANLECPVEPAAPCPGVTEDSRAVVRGGIFVAIPGTAVDARRFIPQATERGAALVVTEPPVESSTIPVVFAPSARHAVALMAHAFHGHPTHSMHVVGVTGTNGKTSTTYLLEAVMAAAGWRPGVIGTVEGRFEDRRWPAPTTTPAPTALASMAEEMVAAGADALAMEVSSHAIDQHRVVGIEFNAGILTNISQDHLDYHGTMEAYTAVKRRLFTELLTEWGGRAIVNLDEPLGADLAGSLETKPLTYGTHADAEVRIESHRALPDGTEIDLVVHGEPWTLRTPLLGVGNVMNIAAVVTWARWQGIARDVIQRGLTACSRIPGRLESIDCGQGFRVMVDYSHTPASLDGALRQCRGLTPEGNRLIVVFGCGGDRDALKRPIMGEIAGRGAEEIWLTNDNPRTEDPAKIAEQVLRGLAPAASSAESFHVELDRRAAIRGALESARPGDVVLIAGKGHETYQEVGKQRFPFDDAEVARQWLGEHLP